MSYIILLYPFKRYKSSQLQYNYNISYRPNSPSPELPKYISAPEVRERPSRDNLPSSNPPSLAYSLVTPQTSFPRPSLSPTKPTDPLSLIHI